MSDLDSFTPQEIEELRNSPELRELFNQMDDPHGYPEPPIRDNILKFFRDVLLLKKDANQIGKVGNLKQGEIGYLSLPIRNYLSLANYCDTEGWNIVGDYLRSKANITTTTSLSKNAKFLELVVTQKRVSKNVTPQSRELKKGLFSTTEKVTGGEED